MTEATHARIPAHLRKYVVEQNYARYTPEDQAVWRYIMRQLKSFLSRNAHHAYLSGLEKTGITIDRIPEIENIDRKLNDFGWGAVPVSGFIPPAAFMEFQSIGVLPIASDMRTLEHLLYTPAPDIVHEAAGHAPILIDPAYAAYLKQYGEVARHTILSKQDIDQYEAIRLLSDIKEDPRSTPEEIERTEKRLAEVNMEMKTVSEAAWLSRMNWWTAEYGLIGDTKNPKIFGAGLLSSVGESRDCLGDVVKKLPLSVDCVNYAYDITEKQPQLFVAKDFLHLGEILEQLADRLSYRRGGDFGLERAVEACTVNTVQLNSGLQISGILKNFIGSPAIYLQFEGPSQLAFEYQELPDQGSARHKHGFSCPIGKLRNHSRCLSSYSEAELRNLGLNKGERSRLQFESGVLIEGILKDWTHREGVLLILTWNDCRVSLDGKTLFDPSWGEYDMAVGSSVASVFGGPADRGRYGETDDFAASRIPARNFSAFEQERFDFYQAVRDLREQNGAREAWDELCDRFIESANPSWLIGVELIEIGYALGLEQKDLAFLKQKLEELARESFDVQRCIQDGLKIARSQA